MLDLVAAMGWGYTGRPMSDVEVQQLTTRVYAERGTWVNPRIYKEDISLSVASVLSALTKVELQLFYDTVNKVRNLHGSVTALSRLCHSSVTAWCAA